MSFYARIRQLLSASIILLALTGCATTANIGPDYQLSAQSGRGVVIVSATYFSSDYDYGYLDYGLRNLSSGQWQRIVVRPSPPDTPKLSPGSWTADQGSVPQRPIGQLFAIELPAGEYRIEGWATSKPGYTVRSTKPLEETFKVTAGQAVYIGNVHTHFKAGGKYHTMRVDERSRDIPLLVQRFPSIKSASLRYDLQPAKTNNGPLGMDALKDLLDTGANGPANKMNNLQGLLPAK